MALREIKLIVVHPPNNMRILCCIDGKNLDQIFHILTDLNTPSLSVIGLLYVTDTGPRHDMERTRERFLRGHHPPPPLEMEIHDTEESVMREILEEAVNRLPGAETISREGRPEHEIVQCAEEWRADLIIICPRTNIIKNERGPKSVGHVARFVLDHAPCPVLLLRGTK